MSDGGERERMAEKARSGEPAGGDEGCTEEFEEPRPRRKGTKSPREFVSCWSERDSLDGKETRAWVLVLRTAGCSWARCAMCGYHGEAAPAAPEDLLHQFRQALGRRKGEPVAKLYTSGSFFDGLEVPAEVRRTILAELAREFKMVVVESRPEFVTEEAVGEAAGLCPGFEVAIGLESASDRVLGLSVRKGYGFASFTDKAVLARKAGARVRAYLLLKPPFLNEKEALDDAVKGLVKAAPFCDTLSLNPVNVQRGTMVEQLWRRGLYRPPWLWTAARAVLDARPRIKAENPDARLVCAPSGAGMERGAHNCGRCDAGVARAIEELSVLQEPAALEEAMGKGCGCSGEWREALSAGAFPFVPYDGLLLRNRPRPAPGNGRGATGAL